MFGLILALLYVALASVTGTPPNEALASSFNFLWYWHLSITIIILSIIAIILCCGALISTKTNTPEIVAGILILGPMAIVVMCIVQASYLIGTYLLILSARGAEGILPTDQWNNTYLILGCVLYFLGIISSSRTSMSYRRES